MKQRHTFLHASLASVLLIRGVLFSAETVSAGPVQHVNPFIGTNATGHTFPGAAVPFGMVQLSPETRTVPYEKNGAYNNEVYRYCSGYQYDDSTICGFSHTHFSGTGHADLGDFLIMPCTGPLCLEPAQPEADLPGYYSRYSHKNEAAEPAYYKTKLDRYGITAELTATARVGFHQYTFPKSDSARIVLDLTANIYHWEDKNVWTFVRVENDTLITGFRQTNGWARTRILYFAMVFSKPFTGYGHKKYDTGVYKNFWRKFDETRNFPEMAGRNIRAYFNFTMTEGEKLNIKCALSSVSTDGALKNLRTETPRWDFNEVKQAGQRLWNRELAVIDARFLSDRERRIFYTALYHTMLAPVVYMDVDGSYRGLDMNIHTASGFVNYTVFSLWDTYRALHPLFNILHPERNADMIRSLLAHYDQSVHKMLPVWSHYSNENWCMIGYHAVSVIADAVVKGVRNFDVNHALRACINTSTCRYYDGLAWYMDLGFVPEDKNPSSVSKTLEYAYDDWCIEQIARHLKKKDIAQTYRKRSWNFEQVFDPSTGFMRPKNADGQFKKEFDPLNTHGQGFIEGNASNYSLYVPHQIDTLIERMGGKEKFCTRLDSLFLIKLDEKHFQQTEDITREGLIGNYVHGNEPSHHIAYLYTYAGKPWKTEERVRMILNTMYNNTTDGLCGNDDAGQMSAWYIFSALGFYPVCPGSDTYCIGSPLITEAVIRVAKGKKFVIKAVNQSGDNVYIQKIALNGSEIKRNYLYHHEIINGGELVFYLGRAPDTSR